MSTAEQSALHNGANATVASNIRAGLAYAGVSQAQLAAHLGIGAMALSRRMTSATEFTSSEIVAVANYLDVEPGKLFDTKNPLQITMRSLARVTELKPRSTIRDLGALAPVTPIGA